MSDYGEFVGRSNGARRRAVDPVNLPAIRRFVEAMGDRNPIYLDEVAARASGRRGLVAPPAMLSVWVAKGLRETLDEAAEVSPVLLALARDGFTITPGTDLLHRFERELLLGDVVTQASSVAAVSDRKSTPLGPAHFVTLRSEYTDERGALVAEQQLTVAAIDPRGERTTPAPRRVATPSGAPLSPLSITLDRLGIIACTTACSDFRAGHYDPDVAAERGFNDIFTDIPTSTALVCRYVTDSYGPSTRIQSIGVRLGVPFYANDTLTLRGYETGEGSLDVVGDTSNGRHLTAKVEFGRL